jgi:hypothetical protein
MHPSMKTRLVDVVARVRNSVRIHGIERLGHTSDRTGFAMKNP